jgi:hypothetical protein
MTRAPSPYEAAIAERKRIERASRVQRRANDRARAPATTPTPGPNRQHRTIRVRLSPDDEAVLRLIARVDRVSIAELVRRAVDGYIDRQRTTS